MFRPAVQVGDYLLAITGWRPRRAWEATSNSRFVFRSSLPLLLPAVQTWERKYSSPYWLKMSFPWLVVVDVSTLLARIITADLESADLSRTTLGATSVSPVLLTSRLFSSRKDFSQAALAINCLTVA